MTNYSAALAGAPKTPTLNITVNKSRLKRYNKHQTIPNYYLNNGQEFQLELFNPTTSVIKADISLNNTKLSGGSLVLHPGERVFLDRYFDSPRKFKFETYEVGNSKEVKKAIEKNGLVTVEFYNEYVPPVGWYNVSPNYVIGNHTGDPYRIPLGDTNAYYSNNSGGVTYTSGTQGMLTNTSTGCGTLGDVTFSPTSMNTQSEKQLLCDSPDTLKGHLSRGGKTNAPSRRQKKKKETGRVGKGSKSDQTFKYVDYQFELAPSHTIEYQILPVSTKQITTRDLNVKRYCTECGTKYSKGNKYCSNCGHKL